MILSKSEECISMNMFLYTVHGPRGDGCEDIKEIGWYQRLLRILSEN